MGFVERGRGATLRTYAPLILGMALLWAALFGLVLLSWPQTGGRVIYALDDPYIHMAMAKNLVLHGSWGVTPDGFSSTSSSPLWVLLLAANYLVFGPNEMAPILFNAGLASLLLILTFALSRQYGLHPALLTATLVLLVFATPLPTLVFSGMEHVLQTLLLICFCALLASTIAELPPARSTLSRRERLLCLISLSLTAVRLEGIFLLSVACLLLVLRKRYRAALGVAACGALPVVAYGVISVAHGWRFLPNSILLKATASLLWTDSSLSAHLAFLEQKILSNLWLPTFLLAGLLLLLVATVRRRSIWERSTILLTVFISTACLHLVFADVGWLLRYEAYLVALGILAIAAGLSSELSRASNRPAVKRLLSAAVASLVVFALAGRTVHALPATLLGITNTHRQQYQMGLFLQRYYPGASVAANDIGAISYLADIHLLDLWGLGDRDVGEARLNRSYGSSTIRQLAAQHDVSIAIVYENWTSMYGGLPREWTRLAQWTTTDDVGELGGETVTFYAVDPLGAARLLTNLTDFSSELPSQVVQRGYRLRS